MTMPTTDPNARPRAVVHDGRRALLAPWPLFLLAVSVGYGVTAVVRVVDGAPAPTVVHYAAVCGLAFLFALTAAELRSLRYAYRLERWTQAQAQRELDVALRRLGHYEGRPRRQVAASLDEARRRAREVSPPTQRMRRSQWDGRGDAGGSVLGALAMYAVILGLVLLFLHGVYSGAEGARDRVTHRVCSTLDASTPAGQECDR